MAAVANNINGPGDAINAFAAGGFGGIIPSAFTNFFPWGGFFVGGTFVLFTCVMNDLLKERGWQGNRANELSRYALSILCGISVSFTIPILAGCALIDPAIICVGIIGEVAVVLAVLILTSKIIGMLNRRQLPAQGAQA